VALSRRAQRVLIAGLCCAALGVPSAAGAVTLSWKGHTWQVTSGGMAGVCQGDPNNVTVDAAGYLHLKISRNNNTWSAAELFTTDRLGFGTYQWQVDGPIDTFDKNVVLGLFPYGPAAGIGADGTNEIDIEYSRWGQANGPNGDWTNYPASGSTIGEMSYTFSLGGATLSTSRFTWTTTSITDFLFAGLQPIDGTAGLIKTWTYAPSNPTVNIPQQALPLGMNLWCFSTPPSDGNPVEIVIRDFSFAAAGAGGTGGASGSGGTGGASGAGGRGGTSGGGGTGGMSGAGGRGGMSGAGGSGGTGGAGTGGTSGTSGVGGRGGASGGGGTGGAAGAGGTGGASGVGGTGGVSGAGGSGGGTGGTGVVSTGSAGSAGTGGASAGTGGASAGTGGTSAGAGGGSAGARGGAGGSGGGGTQGCGCGLTATESWGRGWIGLLAAWFVAARRARRRAGVPRGM